VSAGVFALVMLAALLHALWNALVKTAADRTAVLGLISLGHVILGLSMAFFVPFPAVASWPFILGSTVIHFGYYYLLNRSYRLGDLSHVYPIARGITPVLVTLGAQAAAGEVLPVQAWAGVLAVSAGIILLSALSWRRATGTGALAAALMTGGTIAAYSLVDGLGVRVSGAPLGYIAWLFIMEIFVTAFIFLRRGRLMLQLPRRVLGSGVAGGLTSASAYGLVIWAKMLAPLGIVSSLRETSVLFAALIGVVALGERPWRGRLAAACVVVTGVGLIAFS